jgi:hypothetical protein
MASVVHGRQTMAKRWTFVFILGVQILTNKAAYASGITVVATNFEASGSLYELWYSNIDERWYTINESFGASKIDSGPLSLLYRPPSLDGVPPGDQDRAEIAIDEFSLSLYVGSIDRRAFGLWPDGGEVSNEHLTATAHATTYFHTEGSRLAVDLSTYGFDDLIWHDYGWSLSLTDTTTAQILLELESPPGGLPFAQAYTFDADPSHLYMWTMYGRGFNDYSHAPGGVGISAAVSSYDVPDSVSTLALLGFSIAGLAFAQRRCAYTR